MNVLLTSRSMIPSVTLCGAVQMEELQKQGKLVYRFVKTTGLTEKQIAWADVLIFVRAFSDYERLCFCKAKESGRGIAYVLDDDLLNIPPDITSADLYTDHNKQNILFMIQNADLFLTPNRKLKEKYGTLDNGASLIEEPARTTIEEKKENNCVTIGFAGSVDHTGELNRLLDEAIGKVIEKYGSGIRVEFFGARPEVVDKYHLKYIPYTSSYAEYTKQMSRLNWDIGLAPMVVSEFSSCKHYNKLIEYSSYGIAGIYTECEPYTWAVNDGENGLLCPNTSQDWESAICRLVEGKALRKSISEDCLQNAKTKYSVTVCADDYYSHISSIAVRERLPVRGLNREWSRYLAGYITSIVKKYRFHVFREAWNRRRRHR